MSHERDASMAMDGVTPPVDAGAPLCEPLTPPSGSCTVELQEACQRWAQSLTTEGIAVSSCPLGTNGGCSMGDVGCGDRVWPVDMNFGCMCNPRFPCLAGQVCVQDEPGGETRCAARCDAE